MKKNLVFPIFASISLIAVSSTMAVLSNNQIKAKTRAQTYSIIMNANKNQLASDSAYFHYGTSTVATELGNEVGFSFTNAAGVGAVKLQNDSKGYGGTLYNTTQITGMESISMTFIGSDSMSCSFSYGGTDDCQDYLDNFTVSSSNPLIFDFNGTKPNYFYFLNLESVDMYIESIEITFSCTDAYPYLTVTSESATKGYVTGGNKKILAGSSTTVNAFANTGYRFAGWYAGENLVSNNSTYTFNMPTYAYALEARFSSQAEWEQEKGIRPTLDSANNKIIYGMYPQTVITNTTLINKLNNLTSSYFENANGCYFYEDNYYFSVVAYPFNDGTTSKPYFKTTSGMPTENQLYWFKCEPISWTILSHTGNLYSLVADEPLDICEYYIDSSSYRTIGGKQIKPSNYQYSSVRAFLNGYDGSSYNVSDYSSDNFFRRAFGLNSSYIQQIEVDNSQSSTSSTNTNLCDNTQDKVYLPCYNDTYNLTSVRANDYLCVRGAYVSTHSPLYYSKFWTRTPQSGTSSSDYAKAYCVNYNGNTTNSTVTNDTIAVRPMITIAL